MTAFQQQPSPSASGSSLKLRSKRWMWAAWPAFLVAAVLEMVVFALVDPGDLHWFGQPVTLSREAVYTLAFFVFWGMAMASSALTTLLSMSSVEVNRHSVADDQRPDASAHKDT